MFSCARAVRCYVIIITTIITITIAIAIAIAIAIIIIIAATIGRVFIDMENATP